MRQHILRFCFFLTALLLIVGSDIIAQQSRKMLLYEVNRNEYIKRSYNKQGELQSWQKMNVGTLQKNKDNNTYNLPVKIYSYSADSTLQDSTKTVYICDPDDKMVLLNILPFTDPADQKEIQVKLLDTNAIYPINPEIGWSMEPIHFKLDLDSGIIGFFGGDNRIKMYNRQVVSNDTLSADRYQINSDVSIGAYVMGIKVKGISFDVKEFVDAQTGIVWQRFDQVGNGYFIINLVHSGEKDNESKQKTN